MPDELLRPTIGAGVDLSTRPWRLMSQTYIAFFGGVLAVTVIAFLNARRLGVTREKLRWIVASGVVGLILAVALVSVIPADATGLRLAVRVVAVVTCLVQLRLQQPMDRAFQLRGTDYASLWVPGIITTICVGMVEAILLRLVMVIP